MAESWARHLFGERIEACSAGVAPHAVDARAVVVMREAGIDIGGNRSKHVDTLLDTPFDVVVTVCDHAAEVCPLFSGTLRRLHHSFDDPPKLAQSALSEDEALPHYRRVRDEIHAFILTLPQLIRD